MAESETNSAYKILSRRDWTASEKLGHTLTALDTDDGYVHLSTRHQVADTLSLHYKGETHVRLLEYDLDQFGDALKWEESRGGQMFPHLYGTLHIKDAKRIWTLNIGRDNIPTLPEDIDL